jgi:diguanylate cyclase (GGDEF)-like protein
MNISKILISFLIIIVIAISSAIITIIEMKSLSENTKKMYSHPFQVSNTIANMKTSIVTIQSNMKNIILFRENSKIIKTIETIQSEEEKVNQYLNTIYKYYLGDKKDIDAVSNTFKEWKPIRNELINLIQEEKLLRAIDVFQVKDKNHILVLYKKIDVLRDYAFNKANEFYKKSNNNNSMEYVIFIFILTLIISSAIVYYITVNLFKIGKLNNKQLHLIDQNILMSTVNLNKQTVFITNALCNIFNRSKEDLLHSENEYFFCDKEQFSKFKNKIYLGKEHHGEVFININNEQKWFNIDVYPELNQYFKLTAFNIFLSNIDDKKNIEKVSITDKLTELYNRNYFELIFDKEIRRSKRDQKALCLIMLDIDFFKQFNDTYGHHDGDTALKEVARVFSSFTNRSYDYSFRLGGEEFMILSYDKDIELLEGLSNEIINKVRNLKISHKRSKISNYLTISAGAVLFEPSHLLTQEEMYKKVDSLLYQAKREGRNRSIVEVVK